MTAANVQHPKSNIEVRVAASEDEMKELRKRKSETLGQGAKSNAYWMGP
jgi:hypothetical protein